MEATSNGKSKFSLGKIGVASVKSGERIANETIAVVETASQMNKFRLNKLASEALNVTSGNRVKLLITEMEEMDGKYLIAKAPDTDTTAAKLLSPTGKDSFGSLLFNYAGVWSRMIQMTPDAKEKGGDALVIDGIAIERGKGNFYIDKKVAYEIVEIEDFDAENPLVDPFTGVEYTKVFALVAPKPESVDLTRVIPERKKKVKVEETNTDAIAEDNSESNNETAPIAKGKKKTEEENY